MPMSAHRYRCGNRYMYTCVVMGTDVLRGTGEVSDTDVAKGYKCNIM